MEKKYITVTFKIKGMTCVSCENRIERRLKNTKGISNAIVSYAKGTALVTYDSGDIDAAKISKIISELGYEAAKPNEPEADGRFRSIKIVGIFVILIALYILINRFGGFNLFNYFPQAKQGMGYGMLFVIGLLTSTHCVAMCGGINLSQCVPYKAVGGVRSRFSSLTPSILYNAGRVVSYTVIGGLVGALGSVVSFSSAGKGFIALLAGVFMVVMGLNMLNVFPWLKRFNPRMPKIFAVKINEQKRSNKPLYVGLLNGLMPCGPLQAMQLYALSTGDPLKGALSMLIFSLGTVPLMFGLGALSTVLTRKFASRMMTVSAALVVILGVFMFGNGMALTGYAMPFTSGSGDQFPSASSDSSGSASSQGAKAEISGNVQTVTSGLSAQAYEPIVVQKGIPVKWDLKADAADLNGCNNGIVIPEYNVEKQLEPGDNIIEFTPDKSGVVRFSCWMGMVRSQISVVDDLGNPARVPDNNGSIDNSLPSCCSGSAGAGGPGLDPQAGGQQNNPDPTDPQGAA